MRENEKAAEEYGCLNGSRRRRVYCAAGDAIGGICDSGLVGTCYDGVMAVWSSDHLVDCRRTTTANLNNHTTTQPFANCRTRDRFSVEHSARSRTPPIAAERSRALPSAPESRPECRRRQCAENLPGESFLRSIRVCFCSQRI